MRWKSKKGYYLQNRIINKFLIFPLILEKEWRWLEKTAINQYWDGDYRGWVNSSWVKERKGDI